MQRKKLHNEMIDLEDGEGYYKADVLVLLENSLEGHAHIPGIGRVLVYKRVISGDESFAWYVKGASHVR